MEPCIQKENVDTLFKSHMEIKDTIQDMRVTQQKIEDNVDHVKGRIDNGMSHTLSNLNSLMIRLEPVIQHHAMVVKRIEDIGWWISKIIIGALLALLIWASAHGWKP